MSKLSEDWILFDEHRKASMTSKINKSELPIGDAVPGWTGVAAPPRTPMFGRFCNLEPLEVDRHLDDLFEAYAEDTQGRIWTYMAEEPFATLDDFRAWMEPASQTNDPLFHAIIDTSNGKAMGMAAYMRIKPVFGVIEVGSISYSPRLQKTTAATEAMFLMMQRVFDELAYRRYEWKCDSLNAASGRAAGRLGFTYDGLFKQAILYKGRNRDTAWYSILDSDWPKIRKATLQWLDAENFDGKGRQKLKLKDLIASTV